MTRILVVDDEGPFLRALGVSLRAFGYEVDLAQDGPSGLGQAARHHPDVVVLDLGLPDMDGIEVLRGLRAWSTVPVIVLSARHEEWAKVTALDVGADDYVTKPFGMNELLARIRAALRRSAPEAGEAVVTTGDISIDLGAKRVVAAGGEVRLTPTEWHIVEVLVRNEGKLVSQSQLLREVRGPSFEGDGNYLRVFMTQIRRKLEADPSRPRCFLTEPGMGYRFQRDRPEVASPALGSREDRPDPR
ncbi:MAG: response regulator [Acidimicrobiales bacterium]